MGKVVAVAFEKFRLPTICLATSRPGFVKDAATSRCLHYHASGHVLQQLFISEYTCWISNWLFHILMGGH